MPRYDNSNAASANSDATTATNSPKRRLDSPLLWLSLSKAVAQLRSHQYQEANAEYAEADEEHGILQHRHIVVHQRMAFSGKRGNDDDCRAEAGQRERYPAADQAARGIGVAPENPGKGEKPDQHGEVDVDHQRGAEKIDPGDDLLEEGRARQYDEDGIQATDDQGREAEQQPAGG